MLDIGMKNVYKDILGTKVSVIYEVSFKGFEGLCLQRVIMEAHSISLVFARIRSLFGCSHNKDCST